MIKNTTNHDYDGILNNILLNQNSNQRQQINSNQLYGLPDTRTQLFVGNLPFRVRWQDLKDLMRKVGTVLRADVALSQPDGRSRGFGVVLFAHVEDAHKAVEIYNGFSWQTRILDVRLDSQDPTGALAIAEANRQTVAQQQQQQQQPQQFQSHQQPQQYQLSAHDNNIPWPASIPPPPSFSSLPPHLSPPFLNPNERSSPSSISRSVNSSPNITSAQVQVNLPRRYSSDVSPPVLTPHTPSSPTASLSPNSPTRSHFEYQESPRMLPPPPPPPNQQYQYQSSSPSEWNNAMSSSNNNKNYSNNNNNNQSSNNGNNGNNGGYQSFSAGMNTNSVPQQQQQQYAPPPPGSNNGNSSNNGSIMQNGGLMHFYQGQQRGSSSGPSPNQQQQQQMSNNGNMNHGGGPPGAPNRHIFVGNLPFNLQWQELKDLMRQSGTVLRADIAQGPDGRSRGFGSVLFSSAQDADRAVAMFNGYDYNGRVLKVHFDKFSQTGQSSMSGLSLANSNNLSPYAPQTQNQHPNFSYDNGYNRERDMRSQPSQSSTPSQQQQNQQQKSSIYNNHEIPVAPQVSSYNSYSPADLTNSKEGVPSPVSGSVEIVTVSTTTSPLIATQSIASEVEVSAPVISPPRARAQISPPTRIAMPPAYPSFSSGAFSPMNTNGGRPSVMTPGMPAFTLGAFPQTPPIYPSFGFGQGGMGMFSPGGMVTPGNFFGGGNGGGGRNYMNAAPGAPINRQSQAQYGGNNNYNPMFSPTHLQQQYQQQQYDPNYGGQLSPPTTLSGPNTTIVSNDEPSYFPEVSTLLNNTSSESITTFTGPTTLLSTEGTRSRAVSVTSTITTPSLESNSPPNGTIVEATSNVMGGKPSMILLSEGMQSIQFTTIPPTPPIYSHHAHHHQNNIYSSNSSTPDSQQRRRKSFVSSTSTATILDVRRRFEEGDTTINASSGNLRNVGGLGGDNFVGLGAVSARRASFEDSLRTRPSFGSSSIWASSENGGD